MPNVHSYSWYSPYWRGVNSTRVKYNNLLRYRPIFWVSLCHFLDCSVFFVWKLRFVLLGYSKQVKLENVVFWKRKSFFMRKNRSFGRKCHNFLDKQSFWINVVFGETRCFSERIEIFQKELIFFWKVQVFRNIWSFLWNLTILRKR